MRVLYWTIIRDQLVKMTEAMGLPSHDFAHEFTDQILRDLSTQGYAIAPIEPTEEMLKAGVMAMEGIESPTATTAVVFGQPKTVYKAMLAVSE